jgi:ribosomal protein S6
MPSFRTETAEAFEVTGVDFARPLRYKIAKNKEGKCYILIFTCAASRAVHLELTKSQKAEEFQRKLNSFIGRRGGLD